MVFFNKLPRKCEVFRRLPPILIADPAKEESDVQKHNDQVIKSTECFLFNRKRSVTIGLITALHLHADGSC